MRKHRNIYDEEFKKNAVKLSYASPKSVKDIADDLGVGVNLLYNWRRKYTPEGEMTEAAELAEEVKKMRLENAELKLERDMLKKAADYFANLKKETVHLMCFRTREEARERIFEHVEGFYNTKRVQKRLGYLSPMQWLKQ